MTESRPSRETIRDVAGRVAATAHPDLDEATIDEAIAIVADIDERLQDDPSRDAVEDLLSFWEGYITGGLLAVTETDSVDASIARTELIKRGNEADLYGLDLYQALLELAAAHEESDAETGAAVTDRTANWAMRVADLTAGFVGHLADHK
ncbi:MAG: hypothetical protein ACQEQY_06315 [Halobacteriota archaeon]